MYTRTRRIIMCTLSIWIGPYLYTCACRIWIILYLYTRTSPIIMCIFNCTHVHVVSESYSTFTHVYVVSESHSFFTHVYYLHVKSDDRSSDLISDYEPGSVFSYKLRYIVGFGLVEMAISTNPKPTTYRNLFENTDPVPLSFTWRIILSIIQLYR